MADDTYAAGAGRPDNNTAEEVDQYRELFERSADPILIISDSTFVDCNDSTVKMLGYRDKAELLQVHPSDISPEFQPDGQRSFDKANEMMALAFEKGSHRFEWDHLRADGEVFPVEVLLTVVPRGEGHVLHVVWRDIAERKALQAQILRAQKMESIGQLAGAVAHDFNNLLVAIIGYSEMLATELHRQPDLADQANEINGAALRAAELTAELLACSRKQILKPKVVDVNDVLRQERRMMQAVMGERITQQLEIATEPLFVKVDPAQLEQVILNITNNAKDAIIGTGEVNVQSGQVRLDGPDGLDLAPGDFVSIRISDTGVGMGPEEVEKACDPFYTTKERGRGTGLGLASVHGIVTQSGGAVRVTSERGVGTTVEILLPVVDELPSGEETSAPSSHLAGRGTARVLLVEDEPVVSDFVGGVLRKQGYEVIDAGNGREGLELAAKHAFDIDLVLADVIMPEMSGPEMVRAIHRDHPEIPVLFLSGYADTALSEQGFEADQVDLLRKPFSVADLLTRVAAAT